MDAINLTTCSNEQLDAFAKAIQNEQKNRPIKLFEKHKRIKLIFETFAKKWLDMFAKTMIEDIDVCGKIGVNSNVQWCDLDELLEIDQFEFTYKANNDTVIVAYNIRNGIYGGSKNSISYSIHKDRCLKTKHYYQIDLYA
jgi:hypothetical protein